MAASMPEIEGYQNKQIKHHRTVWVPGWPQILLYLTISVLLLVVFSRETIFAWLGGESLQTLGGMSFITEGENYYLDSLFAIPVLGTLAVIIFWGALGCGLYCLVWGLSNTVREAKKYEQAANDSVLPKGYNKHKFWETSAANIILMISSLCIFLFILLFVFGYALPAAEQLLLTILTNLLSLNALLAVTIFVGTTVVLGHGIYLSLRTFNYARKVVFY